jgi:hypothetical protein
MNPRARWAPTGGFRSEMTTRCPRHRTLCGHHPFCQPGLRHLLPRGSFTGTPEAALDCVCGLYLDDITAWTDTQPDS